MDSFALMFAFICDFVALLVGLRILARLLLGVEEEGIEDSQRRHRRRRLQRRPRTTLFVTAHPDDEAMFFVPAIDRLQRESEDDDDIAMLCLSTGDHDGLGNVRRKELVDSAVGVLGLDPRLVESVDDPGLQDGPKETWDPSLVAKEIARFVDEKLSASDRLALVTFDAYGVSGHPNHGACLEGVKAYLEMEAEARTSRTTAVEAWQLESVGLARNYSFLLDPFFVWIAGLVLVCFSSDGGEGRRGGGAGGGAGGEKGGGRQKDRAAGAAQARARASARERLGLGRQGAKDREGEEEGSLFKDSLFDAEPSNTPANTAFNTRPWLCYRAMVAHWSQFVWYRRLFVIFSRYTYVNTLQRMRLNGGGE